MSPAQSLPEPEPAFVRMAHEYAGDHLRSIATYAQTTYEFQYLREDVRDRYTDADYDQLRETLLMEGLHRPYLSQVFGDQDLDCQVLAFEETTILHFSTDEFRGHVISVDRGGLPELDTLVEACGSELAMDSPAE